MGTGAILLIIIGIIVLFIVVLYNRIIKLKNNVDSSFADIEVQIKARFNLVDNLVKTVKGYASHEKEVLENVTKARTQFDNAKGDNDKIKADNMLSETLKNLFAVAENYPDLKANENFLQLQTELSDIENKISATRRYFNSSVREFNNSIQTFPANIIAGMFGFKEKEYFEVENKVEKELPKVDFSK